MIATEEHITTEMKLKRIAWLSSQNKHREFRQLMHHFNEESLTQIYHELDAKKAIGIDKVSKESYGAMLQENLKDLVARLKSISQAMFAW